MELCISRVGFIIISLIFLALFDLLSIYYEQGIAEFLVILAVGLIIIVLGVKRMNGALICLGGKTENGRT